MSNQAPPLPINPALSLPTFLYLLIPMIIYKQFNFPLIFSLILITAIDIIHKIKTQCATSLLGPIIFITFIVSYLWTLFVFYNMKENLYFGEYISDKVACGIPSKQKFKCTVTKNAAVL